MVCFAADWCPFCSEFVPHFERFELPAGVHRAYGDLTDLESPLWEGFHVDVVPTLALFHDGKLVWRRDGVYGQGLGAPDLAALAAQLTRTP